MRRVRRLGVTFVFSTVALAMSLFVGYRASSQSTATSVSRSAFIAEKRVLHTPSTQQTPVIQRESYLRREDGSYVRKYEVTSPAAEVGWMVEIYDVRGGREIILEPFTKSAMTFYRTPSEMQKWIRSQASCEGLGPDTESALRAAESKDRLYGQEVVEVRTESEGGRRERWIAPQLDCYALQESIVFPTGAYQEHTVTSLQQTSPPDSAFEAPSEYLETSPWQFEMAYQSMYPGHAFWGEATAKKVDERYFGTRARR